MVEVASTEEATIMEVGTLVMKVVRSLVADRGWAVSTELERHYDRGYLGWVANAHL